MGMKGTARPKAEEEEEEEEEYGPREARIFSPYLCLYFWRSKEDTHNTPREALSPKIPVAPHREERGE